MVEPGMMLTDHVNALTIKFGHQVLVSLLKLLVLTEELGIHQFSPVFAQ